MEAIRQAQTTVLDTCRAVENAADEVGGTAVKVPGMPESVGEDHRAVKRDLEACREAFASAARHYGQMMQRIHELNATKGDADA